MFGVGDAMNLPYDDGSLDACRAETLLQHLTDPHQAVHEMTRVTRPGGRAAIPEFDTGTTLAGHPDRETTQVIPQRPADDAVQAWIGRQLPQLFRHAGLTDPSGTPAMVLAGQQMIRMLLSRHVDRLGEENMLTPQQVRQWWSQLDQRAAEGPLIAGRGVFVVAATRPYLQPARITATKARTLTPAGSRHDRRLGPAPASTLPGQRAPVRACGTLCHRRCGRRGAQSGPTLRA
jgi:SAM-dependent methyltransferase